MTSILSLDEAAAYPGDLPQRVFIRHHRISSASAQVLWVDTLRWLWLGAYHRIDPGPKPKALHIYRALIPIDEMWHAFILCTQSYHDFCSHSFGEFLHHEPASAEHENANFDEYAAQRDYVASRLGIDYCYRAYVENQLNFENIIRTCGGNAEESPL